MFLQSTNDELKKLLEEDADYHRGYRDAALGISRDTAIAMYGLENLTLRYYIGHTKSVKNMLEAAGKD